MTPAYGFSGTGPNDQIIAGSSRRDDCRQVEPSAFDGFDVIRCDRLGVLTEVARRHSIGCSDDTGCSHDDAQREGDEKNSSRPRTHFASLLACCLLGVVSRARQSAARSQLARSESENRWSISAGCSLPGLVGASSGSVTSDVELGLANEQRLQTLEAMAATDSLTGLMNHGAFFARLDAEAERARRYGHAMTLAMIDLDNFKEVNDALGHHVGDEVLVSVATFIQSFSRSGDIVARVGGEEFAWLMPETGGHEALRAVERARSICADESLGPIEGLVLGWDL